MEGTNIDKLIQNMMSSSSKIVEKNLSKMRGKREKEFVIHNLYIDIESRCGSPREGQNIDMTIVPDSFECELIGCDNDNINNINNLADHRVS